MKKKVSIFIFLILILLVNLSIISAELTAQEEQDKVALAYDCLKEKIDSIDCTRMSVEQSIFSLLSVNECLTRVSEESLDLKCWPKSNCDLKTTAQAILALNQIQEDTLLAEEWLMSQNMTPNDLNWFLEVDSLEPTTCSTNYGSKTFNFKIAENKKIIETSGDGTPCLSVSTNGYWIEINKNCYDETFETTCDQNFLTTLIFKKSDAPTIYVLDSTNSQSAGGITIEKINSLCFSKSGITCNYEGSLWAALVLNSRGHDVSAYMPYLVGESIDNTRYSPESFLYYLTSEVEYRTQIFENQISDKYWQNFGSNNKYYDTALELYPFQGESGISEKTNTKEWLLTEAQGQDGCWDSGNIISNAFLLHSIWPEYSGNPDPGSSCGLAGYNCVEESSCAAGNEITQYTCGTGMTCCDSGFGGSSDGCEENGFFCVSGMNCEGNILYEYDCSGLYLCCDVNNEEKTCAEWGGDICTSNEYCQSGETISTPNLNYGESCCMEGSCTEIEVGSDFDCEENYGICEISSCGTDYEKTTAYSCEFGDSCCIKSTTPGPSTSSGSKWWIWVLVILIIIVLVAVVFRDKIKEFLIKNKSRKTPSGMQGRGFPPGFPPSRPMGPPPQRRIMPPPRRPMPQRMPAQRPGEINDVLKKLKDMSR